MTSGNRPRRAAIPPVAGAALALGIVLGCAAGAWGQPTPQADPAEPTATGAGAARCGRVTEEASVPGSAADQARAVYQAWAEGFLTALNVEQARRQAPVTDQGAMPPDAQWALLVDHCRRNPEDRWVLAVATLAGALNRTAPAPGRTRDGVR